MIRPATPADAEGIAEVQYQAWWRAYPDYVDPGHFGTLEERVAQWRERLGPEGTAASDGGEVLVAEVAGRTVAFLWLLPGQVRALYVDPRAQGAGLGRTLLEAGEEWLRGRGDRQAWLWVFEANGHARHFYEGAGWVPDGQVELDPWAPKLRYVKEL